MAVLYGAKGASETTSDLYTIDPVTGAGTSVGPLGVALTGLTWDATTDTMYGSTSYNSAVGNLQLCTVNLTTGAATLIGPFGLGEFTEIIDIACSRAGAIYGINGDDHHLYSINKTTGAATHIGDGGSYGGLAFSGDTLWNSLGVPFTIYTIDTATGTATDQGYFPFDEVFAAEFGGMCFSPDGVLYASGKVGFPDRTLLSDEVFPLPGLPQEFVTQVGSTVDSLEALSFDAAAGEATDYRFDLQEAVGIEAPDFQDLPEGAPLAVTGDVTRRRVMLARTGQSLSLRVTQSKAAALSELYSVEIDYRVDPTMEDGQ